MERRKSKRYRMRAPVTFRWVDYGVEHKAVGSALNISPIGVAVLCDGYCPPLGTAGTLEVKLSVSQSSQRLHLESNALIVRAEEILGTPAFTATVTEFKIALHTPAWAWEVKPTGPESKPIPPAPPIAGLTILRHGNDIVHCRGRITSDTVPSLKTVIKPLFSESKKVVLDLTDVNYVDSSGLGALVGLYISAKFANSQLKLIYSNERLKELFSIAKLDQLLAEGA
jgi:anti-sigma B factor antagonist